MNEREPRTFGRDGKPAAVKSLIVAPFFGFVGAYFGGDAVASALGTGTVTGQAVAGAVPVVLLGLLAYAAGGRGSVSFRPDSVDLHDESVPYEAVAVAVRKSTVLGDLFGTGTFELVVPGTTNLTLRYVRQPGEVSRLLAEWLTPPAEQLAEKPGGTTESGDGSEPDHLDERWELWQYWQAADELPETAVVSMETVEDVMDVDAVNLDRLDGVDLRDVEALSDVDESDVTSSGSDTYAP